MDFKNTQLLLLNIGSLRIMINGVIQGYKLAGDLSCTLNNVASTLPSSVLFLYRY